MDISVVVITRDRPEHLRLLMTALARQSDLPGAMEVVVVDDGSRQDPAPALDGHGTLQIRLVRQPPQGVAAARNTGLRAAAAEVVLCVDDDVLFDAGFVAAHATQHAAAASLAVVGDRYNTFLSSLERADNRAAVDQALDGDWKELHRRSRRDYYGNQTLRLFDWHPHALPAPWLCFVGRNVSFRRADAAAVGDFDEGFRQWGLEDLDLGLRLHRAGISFRYEPRARVYHLETPLAATKLDALQASLNYFAQRHEGLEAALLGEFLFGRIPLEELCASLAEGSPVRLDDRADLTYFNTRR